MRRIPDSEFQNRMTHVGRMDPDSESVAFV
jgi:hypothetical protein